MNNRLTGLQSSATVRFAETVWAMERSGASVIKLQIGDPDFDTHPKIVAAANKAMQAGLTHYSMTQGLVKLRTAVSERLSHDIAVDYKPEEILITHGGVHAVFCAINAIVSSGDEVLILDPSWMPYSSAAELAGGVPVRVPSGPDTGFAPDIDRIKSSITPKTKLLVINSPCNPSGHVLSVDALTELAELAVKHGLYVLSDDVYSRLIYDDTTYTHIATLPGMRERSVAVNSLSKTYAMTGWRIGWLSAPRELAKQILKMSQYTITHVAPFVQQAAITALTDRDVQAQVSEMIDTYGARREMILKALGPVNRIDTLCPDGAFYVLIDISQFGS
ncbi:MAG: aminotransferase class I/II-fold pyridoxal phosphate-dependent enzyme, partial [candidate division Zixibacteria bacterium]